MNMKIFQDKTLRFSRFLLIFAFMTTACIGTVSSETIVSISPETQSVEEGEDFTLSIYIEPDTTISGAQFDLIFDNSLVNVNSIQEGDLFKQTGDSTIFSQGTINNPQGMVTDVHCLILGKNIVTKPGTLATIDIDTNNMSGICEFQLSNVIVSNSNGFSMPTKVVNGKFLIGDIPTFPSETTSSESGGGGGGSDSGEDHENIELKEVTKVFVNSNSRISYQFNNSNNPITSINYKALKSAGFITTTIEVLEDISSLVDEKPKGKVYKNLNIWVGKYGYATEENIDDPIINFRVSKVWLEDNQIPVSTIELNRHHKNTWNPLPTVQINEDTNYVFFEAKTPGFSPFAITGQDSQAVQDTEDILTSADNAEITQSTGEEKETAQDDKNYLSIAYAAGGIILILAVALILRKK